MIQLSDIVPLSDFQRNTKEHIRRLKKTGRPEVLTVNGRAQVVVQDAKSYQAMLDEIEHQKTLAAIRQGLEDVKAGRTRPAEDVFADLEKRLAAKTAR